MNSHAVGLPRRRGFRTSITAVVSALLLVGAVQTIVAALQEPVHPAVIWLINLAIKRGRFQFSPIYARNIVWPVVVVNLLLCLVQLSVACWLASRNYRNRSEG